MLTISLYYLVTLIATALSKKGLPDNVNHVSIYNLMSVTQQFPSTEINTPVCETQGLDDP